VAGFEGVDVEATRVYCADDLVASECCSGDASLGTHFSAMEAAGGRLISAFVRASKPPR
jgi:hypothetical protein